MLSYSNLVSAILLHFEELYEVLIEMTDKAGAKIVLEGHQKFLAKVSHWVLICKFYEYSGQVNVPGIGGRNRWE